MVINHLLVFERCDLLYLFCVCVLESVTYWHDALTVAHLWICSVTC